MRDPVVADILSLIIPGGSALQRAHSGGNSVVDSHTRILAWHWRHAWLICRIVSAYTAYLRERTPGQD